MRDTKNAISDLHGPRFCGRVVDIGLRQSLLWGLRELSKAKLALGETIHEHRNTGEPGF